MSVLNEHFTLSNGVRIDKIGFGTWQIPDGQEAYDAVSYALKNGYRHIDTARAYGNEESVGRAVRDSGIPRDEIFVTTKLPADIKDYDRARASFEESSSLLGIGHVDLYLVHWPSPQPGQDHAEGNQAVWRAMEEFTEAGRIRSIGVSNFSIADLESLNRTARIRPMVNQIRWHAGYTQDELTAYCKANDILVEGYSPLATGKILKHPELEKIAAKYDRSVAQVSLRYLLEKDILPLPKSVTPERISQNTDLDFTLSAEDVAFLDGLEDDRS
ncbi:2,5-diketo-D-gluconic acid reductase [Kineosporia sp. NBRC 101677]|uniref:aldo/keto reductase n=1 Tax=Kineosporia sp. NBRC 101677 TaxID=3032197 RepID=UPI0024A12678|nr:aldo/keto reductase [Kineosporia sp. NBRC 101677]GLY19477.1 2,5-diketo-D-gluconic acid reductase [Kineosporia sp. NBRC 101677]